MSPGTRDRNARDRASDIERGIRGALKNGAGTLISRSLIIFVFPVLAFTGTVIVYAAKLTLDDIQKDISAVAHDMAVVKETVTGLSKESAAQRQDVTQLQIEAATIKAKATAIEANVSDLRQARQH